ncbi:MAG: efflux RND transporter periplasmic adaptor subunit [Planctomycetales bacterium]|nr:efflux RND transporter periplasmic adaptor subunit [Planctomycetales bacterium]
MRWLVIGILILSSAVGVFVWQERQKEIAAAKARERPAVWNSVSALGRIRPLDDVVEVGVDASRRLGKLLVTEGQSVKKGDILAYLEDYEELKAAAEQSASLLLGGLTQLAARLECEMANIARAEADVNLLKANYPNDLEIQEASIEKLKTELGLSRQESVRNERLYRTNSVSLEEFDRKTSEVVQREKALQVAEAELSKLKTGFPLELVKAESNLALAKATLTLARSTIDIPTLESSMKLAKSQLSRAVVSAPSDGQILKIHTRPGEVVRSQKILTMANLDHMCVVAEIYETDLLRLQAGQKVVVTAAALPQPLTGQVSFVSRSINQQAVYDLDPASASDSRVAEIRILLDKAAPASWLVNLQVAVAIEAPAERVLQVVATHPSHGGTP